MKITLVQKVLLSVIALFIAASALVSIVVARQIKQAYVSEQKRNVADIVRRQAKQHLALTDFRGHNPSVLPRFIAYQNEIITQEIVRIKIYDTAGVVLYSDQAELIGQNLFAEEPGELKEILRGTVVADISKPNKKENVYEKQYAQLLEIYTPISFDNSGVVGIIEIYYNLDVLSGEILRAQTYIVATIASVFAVLFSLLFIIVRRASHTIIRQDKQLQEDIRKEQEYSSLKDEFIRLSSHQLRTPASAIKWSVELLSDESTGTRNEQQKKLIQSIRVNTETLISIINNFLVVADIKPDYFVFEKDSYALVDITEQTINIMEEKIKKKNLTVTVVPVQTIQQITPRKDAVEKVITILLDNALDYTPEGGKITIRISQKGTRQQFAITDTGIGIPQGEQGKIFDKLFRASNSIEQKNAGSGLSLYIAKKIIEGYAGTMWFASGKNGSTFTFEIPTKSDR